MAKIRLTLYNKDQTIAQDRLTEFQSEMYQGPKETHDGPIRMDVLLENTEQITPLIEYLNKLIGVLPIEKAKRTYSKTPNPKELNQSTTETIINKAISSKNQDELINYLREMNFAFLSFDHLEEICTKNEWALNIEKESHKSYQFMARVLRLAKDPKNDKIDPTIIFAIKFLGERAKGFHIYLSGYHYKSIKKDWEHKDRINFKVKEKFYSFPDPMTYDERSKWRAEDRKVHNNKDYSPSAFYTRWKPYVTIHQPLK